MKPSQIIRKSETENLIVRRHRKKVVRTRFIFQADLEECKALADAMNEAATAWKAKREYIRKALAAGAAVEPGPHWIERGEAVVTLR